MGARVMDFTAQDFEQLELLTDLEVSSLDRMKKSWWWLLTSGRIKARTR